MDTIVLKTINYRGGIVRFRIPENWVEEYEDAGGGTFYAPGDDTGTLRLSVLTMESPRGKAVDPITAAEVLQEGVQKYGASVVPLRAGIALIQYDLPAVERGHSLNIRYWRVAQSLSPRHVRLAIFSYTLLADQFNDPTFQDELDVIDREIRAAELAPGLGDVPVPKKPWWRPW